ncbi:MAG: FAD-binding oxidoreductase [Gammaproteobacteria bacterium]|nr:FAD-binding oxidoreductase [Gammaproteobacteria bacterium]
MSSAATEPHVRSYYAASVPASAPAPPLVGEQRCDVCVVGAGLTGLTAALELAARGFDVIVLEAHTVGWGASGRSGGQLIFGYACDMPALARLVTPEDARRLWDWSLEAVADVRARVVRHAIDCDWADGQIHVALKPRQRDELREWQALLARAYGYDGLEFVAGDALAAHVASPRYCAGLYDPRGAHLHPLKYVRGLAGAAREAGVRLHEQSRALRIARGAAPVVHTGAGQVHCRYVVLAGNAYLGPLVPELDRRIMPVGTYIVASAPLGAALAARCLPTNAAVTDLNFVLDYFRCSADHRMLFGGRVSYSKIPPPNLSGSMRARMRRVFPQLAAVPIDHAWGGYVDITLNRAPDFGRLDGTLYYAQGFSGHGMATTGLAGRVIAEALAGDATRLDVFARIPHRDFPGGRWLRTPSLVLAMLYYRLRDWL